MHTGINYFFNTIMILIKYEGWGLSHGNYLFFARLIDHEETWKYTSESGWC